NTDGAAFLFSHFAQAVHHARVFLVRSVGKIQPRHIHAQAHQVAHHRFCATRRPNGAHDLGFSHIRSCALLKRLASGCHPFTPSSPWRCLPPVWDTPARSTPPPAIR